MSLTVLQGKVRTVATQLLSDKLDIWNMISNNTGNNPLINAILGQSVVEGGRVGDRYKVPPEATKQ